MSRRKTSHKTSGTKSLEARVDEATAPPINRPADEATEEDDGEDKVEVEVEEETAKDEDKDGPPMSKSKSSRMSTRREGVVESESNNNFIRGCTRPGSSNKTLPIARK